MRWLGLLLPGLCLAALLPGQPALTFPRPEVIPPDKMTLDNIKSRTDKLSAAIDRLVKLGVRDPSLADAEVFLKAAEWIERHQEYFDKNAGKTTLAVLDEGLLRASQLGRGESPWLQGAGRTVARGYRSRIDGSVQPYAVTYPHDFATNNRKRYRLDIVLHGRQAKLTEVQFLHDHRFDKDAPKDLAHVRIDVYGRGNNAYRWAGEQDVWEAVENFLSVEGMLNHSKFIDTTKVVLRGFSMGGAGTWHIGLHRPDQFVAIAPGAGFTTTIGYVSKKVADSLTDYQKACLHIYDAVDYAENAFMVPVVAYSGEKDAQIEAARNIEKAIKPFGITITHLVAPGLKHSFPEEEQKKVEAELKRIAEKGKPEYPNKVRFVTWTLKYPTCYWVDVLSLDRHYHRTLVEAERKEDGFAVKTTNVRALRLAMWPGAVHDTITVTIDGQKMTNVLPYLSRNADLTVYLEKRKGKWASVLPEKLLVDRLRTQQKTVGLQGPIDDAFLGAFLCVRGTGKAWNDSVQEHAKASLERFENEWSKFLRGDLPIKDDTKVTAEDLAGKHLILFGDPGSNSLIEQALPRLPFQWTAKEITWAGKKYDSATHVPVLIHPSPVSTDHYAVLNSGHTFHADAFEGTNALLYPRLGDYALLKLTGGKKDPLAVEVVAESAGIFDDFWHLPGRP